MAADPEEERVVIGGRKHLEKSQVKAEAFFGSMQVDVAKFDLKKREDLIKYGKEFHEKFVESMNLWKVPQPENLLKETFTPKEEKDLTCEVTVIRPKNPDGKLPGCVYIHGGGMCLGTGKEGALLAGNYATASKGFVVCSVHFTNSYVESFPRGLNDCVNAIQWFQKNQQKFGLLENVGVFVYGESGGANLGLASAIKLKEMKKSKVICGLHLDCPWTKDLQVDLEEAAVRYPSHLLNRNEDFAGPGDALQRLYTPDPKDHRNPLAWPSFGTKEDFADLPPTMIVLQEIDENRDVGVELYRKMLDANVEVACKIQMGMMHGGHGVSKIMAPVFRASMERFARMCTGVEPSHVNF